MTNLLDIHVILLVVAVVLFTSARKHVSYTLHFSHVPNILLKYKKSKILRLEYLVEITLPIQTDLDLFLVRLG